MHIDKFLLWLRAPQPNSVSGPKKDKHRDVYKYCTVIENLHHTYYLPSMYSLFRKIGSY